MEFGIVKFLNKNFAQQALITPEGSQQRGKLSEENVYSKINWCDYNNAEVRQHAIYMKEI